MLLLGKKKKKFACKGKKVLKRKILWKETRSEMIKERKA
jgi:hypothetical protein